MAISVLRAAARHLRAVRACALLALPRMARAVRRRRAARLSARRLDAVPDATLRDIGMTRAEVFAGVRGGLAAARR